MHINDIREALHKVPFQPFVIRLADGRQLHVRHPDFVALLKRSIIVTSGQDESWSVVEPLLIVSLEFAKNGHPTEGGEMPTHGS